MSEPQWSEVFKAADDAGEMNFRMRRPMSFWFALVRMGFFAVALLLLGPFAPSWALFGYVFCFSVLFVSDFLFGIGVGMFAGGALLGLAKWGFVAIMIGSALFRVVS